ncbi:protein crumbs homolog 3-like [Hypanus sabinus]|uniref:protein crumbs homolog 3-like n=1 Tax=Hypanus sabinus TaxID=79690 RepID=UPI0028C3BB29|nr:protein crumbs homolog 3-like [Hypanus sabinus]XP_059848280.1 protein crumbs homolog 3-like [Hypanus sabinus]XP_059848281.1 protein crumbs homolog 3-like [Hypanus sabinus]
MEQLQRLLVLALLGVATFGKSFAANTTTSNATTPVKSETPIAAIVAPCVIGGVLLIAIILTVVIIKVKGKRREEGTYNPSQQEQIGARTQINHGLKLPPEERLI